MYINILGVIINEKHFGEKNKYLTIITNDNKKIDVICKGKINLQKTYIFLYGNFMLLSYRNKYRFIDIEIKKNFHILHKTLMSYSLACYILEVSNKLNYNDFHTIIFLISKLEITKSIINIRIIKLVFELFILKNEGYMPNIKRQCMLCSKKILNPHYFSIINGGFICCNCIVFSNTKEFFNINKTIYKCLNFIIDKCDIKKALLFNANNENIILLSNIIEKYFFYHIDLNFNTINFYNNILIFNNKNT